MWDNTRIHNKINTAPIYQFKSIWCRSFKALITGTIRTQVWNKLYRGALFDNIRFPDGRAFEDILTTHKVLMDTMVVGVDSYSYHYIQRGRSISQSHDIQNLTDYWEAHKQRYEDLKEIMDDTPLLKLCASAIDRVWVWYWKCEKNPELIKEISTFTRDRFPVFGLKDWQINMRIITFLSRFNHPLSHLTAYIINQIYRILKPKYYE